MKIEKLLPARKRKQMNGWRTGGEPLLQQQSLESLLARMHAVLPKMLTEMETNTTILPTPRLQNYVTLWNVSPKLSNSKNNHGQREIPCVLHAFARLPNAYFKFVLQQPADIGEVEQMVATYTLPAQRVLLMPQAVTPEQLAEKRAWIEALAQERGYRVSPRIHIQKFGNRRAT